MRCRGSIKKSATRCCPLWEDCFLEATGIAAGAAIIGGLGKNVMTKSALKSTIKLAAKVGGRTLSGIGLALIAAEVAWCMW